MSTRRRSQGVVLLVVLFFALLLTSSIATFVRRATVDHFVAFNRDAASRAEWLARGGVRLATALLVDDRVRENEGALPLDSHLEDWFRVRAEPLVPEEGSELTIEIADEGSVLNLNALFDPEGGGPVAEQTEPFLVAVLEKVIAEMPVDPGSKAYDPRELAAHLFDWVDEDDVRQRGGPEDAWYQQQDPPYRAANRPLLSLDELRLVEGFDDDLVDALALYAGVHPYVGGGGINPNTAPPHVLALLFFDDGVGLRLASEDTVRRILRVRERAGVICPQGMDDETCTPLSEIIGNAVYPPPTWSSEVFRVAAEARVGAVHRRVEAVYDRAELDDLLLLSWRVR